MREEVNGSRDPIWQTPILGQPVGDYTFGDSKKRPKNLNASMICLKSNCAVVATAISSDLDC
jgi:hypothetical protein